MVICPYCIPQFNGAIHAEFNIRKIITKKLKIHRMTFIETLMSKKVTPNYITFTEHVMSYRAMLYISRKRIVSPWKH